MEVLLLKRRRIEKGLRESGGKWRAEVFEMMDATTTSASKSSLSMTMSGNH